MVTNVDGIFDIRVLHHGAKSNANHNTPAKMYNKHERERKKRNMETAEYRLKKEPAIKLQLNGLVFSTTGGMGPHATMFLKDTFIEV